MNETWTFSELVEQAAATIATLPPPKNGQVRAVPDERTVRYYMTLGLLDRPLAMRGRTALYGRRHVAQVVAIKRLQSAGRSLADIQILWRELDDATLVRMSGVAIDAAGPRKRGEFWKAAPAEAADEAGERVVDHASTLPRAAGGSQTHTPSDRIIPNTSTPTSAPQTTELRIALASGAVLSIALPADAAISPADVRALRAAAAPLVTELARRGLTSENT